MFRYLLKNILVYVLAVLAATAALLALYSASMGLYRLYLKLFPLPVLGQNGITAVSIGVSTIAVIAPVIAIMEALISWLKLWREARLKAEMVRVIDAQSTSPGGMDIQALERASRLPHRIVQERVNELILAGRIGVRLDTDRRRIYFLTGEKF